MPRQPSLRIVQWATGNIGSRALRRVIEHPHLELVGVHVYGADKTGRDAGELCGMAATGVTATDNIDDIIALRPDCVLYMPQETNLDEVCALLEAGINVVTTRGDFIRPASMNPSARARVEAACARGNTSIHSTGISPGFKTEAVPLLFASLQRRLDHVSIEEFSDVSARSDSPEMLFDVMGFGAKPGQQNAARRDQMLAAFQPSLESLADAVGMPLDRVEASVGFGLARGDVRIAAGVVPKGTVAAMRTVIAGIHQGAELLRFAATWYVSPDVETDDGKVWSFPEAGWRVAIEGDTPMEISVRYTTPAERYFDMTPNLTAHPPINAIAHVCRGRPGILTTLDLPLIVPDLG